MDIEDDVTQAGTPLFDYANMDDTALAATQVQAQANKAAWLRMMRDAQGHHRRAMKEWEDVTHEIMKRRLASAGDPVREALIMDRESDRYPGYRLIDAILGEDIETILPSGTWDLIEHHRSGRDELWYLAPTLKVNTSTALPELAAGLKSLITRWSEHVEYPQRVSFYVTEDALWEDGVIRLVWDRSAEASSEGMVYRDYYGEPAMEFSGTLLEACEYLAQHHPATRY